MKISLMFYIVFLLSIVSFSQEINHLEENKGWRKKPTTMDYLNQQIESAAYEYNDYAPIPRGAFFDIAYPADSIEYDSLKGNALVLISCLVQDSIEIPPKRLYLISGDVKYNLKHIVTLEYNVPDSSKLISKVFGKYRSDSIYLLPIYLKINGSELYLDYATNRSDFRLAVFDDSVHINYVFKEFSYNNLEPDINYVFKFIMREFPSFIVK